VKNQDSIAAAPVVILTFWCVAMPFLLGWLPTVTFDSEEICIDVYPRAVTVHGKYFYNNRFPFPVLQGMWFPVPQNSLCSKPIYQFAQDNGHRVLIKDPDGRRSMTFLFKPWERKCVEIFYRQDCPTANGTYILLTTKSWGAPIRFGDYYIVPHGIKVAQSNYSLNSHNSDSRLEFERTNFMPTEDWHFAWITDEQPTH
jgi:hypothetical protein